MMQLDKTFPTLDCSACILTPKMSDVGNHPNIEMHTYSEVTEVKGYVGNFKVTIKKKPRYIVEDKCNACGTCVSYCPVEMPDEFNLSLSKTKCLYIPFPQAVPGALCHQPRLLPVHPAQGVQAVRAGMQGLKGDRSQAEGKIH